MIRATVQYNLFAGTVVALGSPAQIQDLVAWQQQGLLGCFALTEKLAGVNSGLVVNTTATWVEDAGHFVLSSPNLGAEKNWISQGMTADKAVVIADLRFPSGDLKRIQSAGPHAFVMDFRKDGKLIKGITLDDMGMKSVGNDLDNAVSRADCRAAAHSAATYVKIRF